MRLNKIKYNLTKETNKEIQKILLLDSDKKKGKGAFTHTQGEAARRTRVQESATESRLVRLGKARRDGAVRRR